MRPQSSATAIPRFTSLWKTMSSPTIEAFTSGRAFRAAIAARRMNGRYVSFVPYCSSKRAFTRLRSLAMPE